MRPMSIALGGLLAGAISVMTAFAAGETAVVMIKQADGSDAGTITLTEATAGVLFRFELKGLPPGPHGIKVHEAGNCDADFKSAGAIYNPLGAKHGFLNDEGPMAGDLPNIYTAADGTTVGEFLSPFLTLSTEAEETLFDPDGSSIIIYEKADDYQTDPDGSSGARLACGKIATKK